MALINKLSAIGDAVRERTGLTDELTLDRMATEIKNIPYPVVEGITITQNGTYSAPVGIDGYNEVNVDVQPKLEKIEVTSNGTYTPSAGNDGFEEVVVNLDMSNVIPEEGLTITGDCSYRFSNNGWNWFIEQCGDKITTKDITILQYTFSSSSTLTEIPFDINIGKNITALSNVFYSATKLKSVPYIIGPERSLPTGPYNGCLNLGNMFSYCYNLKSIPNDYFWKIVPNKDFWDKQATLTTQSHSNLFNSCYSLREYPDISMLSGVWTSAYSNLYYNLFANCYILDEIENLPVLSHSITSNYFYSTFNGCSRIKDITFAVNEDGTPKTAKWKNQTIDLSINVGSCNGAINITNYNSGLTEETRITDDTTYLALKDNPDSWTTDINYSRYNHTSAVNTINSLPDCSATGTNTIKFKGASGALTDGGAINTLTEEEIAVATAKGWTVTLV